MQESGKTGFTVVRSQKEPVFRVSRAKRSPLDPIQRALPIDQGWSRWDVPGHRTIYAGAPAACSYAETLTDLRLRPSQNSLAGKKLSDFFDLEPDQPDDWILAVLERDRVDSMNTDAISCEWRRPQASHTVPACRWLVCPTRHRRKHIGTTLGIRARHHRGRYLQRGPSHDSADRRNGSRTGPG